MPIIRFDNYELDEGNYKLRKDGEELNAEPLVFNLIALLATKRGSVVTKDEIADKIWDGRFVSDSAITTAIKSARKVLGDTGEKRRYIKTIRGRGFEFVCTTHLVTPATDTARQFDQNPTPLRQDISFVSSDDGVQIAAASMGDGPVILRTAHWLSNVSLDADSPVFRHWFGAFSKKHKFIRYDLRGSGLSDHDVDDISFDAFVSDLEAVAATIDEPFTLVGMSQGAAISMAYTVRHPERVKQLILYGAYGQGMAARARTERERIETATLENLILLGWGSKNPAFNQVFTNLFIPGGSETQHAWWRELEHRTASPENAARILRANNHIDVFELASRISVPTLIFHCREDARVPFEQGRKLAAVIPGAQFVPLDSENHVLLEHEPAWNTFLAEFESFVAS